MIRLKRAYVATAKGDGTRILVERLWPRGVSKARAKLDLWLKDVAPSAKLRTWFNHDPAKWPEFQKRYRAELKANRSAVSALRQEVSKGPVTLVFAAHDEERNSAAVLRSYLLKT